MLHHVTILLGLLRLAWASPINPRDTNDLCGPRVQNSPNNPVDTCVTPVKKVFIPNAYGAYADTDPSYTLSPSNTAQPYVARDWFTGCEASIASACRSLATAQNGTWIWSSDGPYCQVGYFLPPSPDAAVVPSEQHCITDVLTPMATVAALATTPYSSINRISVNLRSDLPDQEGYPVVNGTQSGVAVNSGYASWILQGYVPCIDRLHLRT